MYNRRETVKNNNLPPLPLAIFTQQLHLAHIPSLEVRPPPEVHATHTLQASYTQGGYWMYSDYSGHLTTFSVQYFTATYTSCAITVAGAVLTI